MELSKLQERWTKLIPINTCLGGEELGFSHHDCECCGSPLGGDRYRINQIDSNGDIIEMDACVDCLMYVANGDVPDDEYIDWLKEE